MKPETKLTVDANLLAISQEHYRQYGFVDTPTPWLVGEVAYHATCPPEVVNGDMQWQAPLGLYHVASAEQGFIQLLLSGERTPPKAQSTTPCFRWEQRFDEDHLPFFYKLELYDQDTSDAALLSMIGIARVLFTKLGVETDIEETSEGYDVVTPERRELGSYGIRHFRSFSWAYGTGIALPRFQQALLEPYASGTE